MSILNKRKFKLSENLPNSAEKTASSLNLKKKVGLIRDMFEKSDQIDTILPLKDRNVDHKSAYSRIPNPEKSRSEVQMKERNVLKKTDFNKQQTLKNYFFKGKEVKPQQNTSIGKRNLHFDDLSNENKF